MKAIKNLYALAGTAVAGATLALTGTAHAAASLGDNSAINPNGDSDFSSGATDFQTQFLAIANKAINIILIIAGTLAVLYLIYSGIQYITSAGSPDKAKSARAGIINSVIGIIIITSAFFIVKFAVGIGQTVSTSNG